MAERLGDRSADAIGAERRRAVDAVFQILDRRLTDGRILVERVLVEGGDDGDRGAPEADLIEHLPKSRIVVRTPLEHRNLHSVVAGRFQGFEDGAVLLRDVGRPEQHAKSDLHGRSLASAGIAVRRAGTI